MTIPVLWKSRARWLFIEPWILWLSVCLLLVTFAVLFMVRADREPLIRWWGMALQFVGIISVVHDLQSTQRHVNRPGAAKWIREWAVRWPGRKVTIALAGASTVVLGGTARLTVRAPVNPQATIEERLVALEQNFCFIDRELDQLERTTTTERTERVSADTAEAAARIRADDGIKEHFAEVAAGTVSVSLFGVWSLAAGVLLGSGSAELGKWLL